MWLLYSIEMKGKASEVLSSLSMLKATSWIFNPLVSYFLFKIKSTSLMNYENFAFELQCTFLMPCYIHFYFQNLDASVFYIIMIIR